MRETAFSIRRTYTFHTDSYKIDIKDEVAGPASYWITLGSGFRHPRQEGYLGTRRAGASSRKLTGWSSMPEN